ncbi:putative pyridoxamine-phosphate oxidase [Desulfosarcina variabilis str. Montpellier]
MNATPPVEKEYKEQALSLIEELSTLTLATSDAESVWAAPVYFVFYKNAFFFFSDPESLHITQSQADRPVAAAIHASSNTWQGIRGLQMAGRIKSVRPGITAVQALRAYIKKFPFTRDFFEDGQSLDLVGFSKRFRVKLYCFAPQRAYYLDNSIRFGFRTEIQF